MHKADDDIFFMKKAIAIARKGIEKGQTPFGACVVTNRRILAMSHNKVLKNKDITAHAEIETIRKACKKVPGIHLLGATIYSTCEPCPMCYSAIHWSGITRIVYGADIADADAAGFRELPISNRKMRSMSGKSMTIDAGMLRDECRELFRIWKNQPHRKTY